MAGVNPIQMGQPVLLPQNPVQPANSSWLKTASTVATIVIGVLSSIASFIFLPAESAVLATGFIGAAALALYACIKQCFPNAPAPARSINLPVQLPPRPIIPIGQPPVFVQPPQIFPPIVPQIDGRGPVQQGGRGPLTPVPPTVHPGQGHLSTGSRRPLTPVPPTVHPGQGHLSTGSRGPTTFQPGTSLPQGHISTGMPGVGRGQVSQPRPPAPFSIQAPPPPQITPITDPSIAFARRVVDEPALTRSPESGREGTIKPGLGSHQPLTGPTTPVGRRSSFDTSTTPQPRVSTPPSPPRTDPGLGSTIRIGAGPNQAATGPTTPVGRRSPSDTSIAPQPRVSTPPSPPRTSPGLGSTIRIGAGSNQIASGPTVSVGSRGRG